ncbi:hypothetical protein [Fibrobacter sp.]
MELKKIILSLFAALMLVACAGTPDNNNDETRAKADKAYQEVDAE